MEIPEKSGILSMVVFSKLFRPMKRFSLFASVILLVCACQLETEIQPENSGFKTVTINAGDAGTRTAVHFDGVNYSVTWKAGDQISVAEVIQGNYSIDEKSRPAPYQIKASDALAADAATASFNITFADRTSLAENPTGDDFRYVGVYPSGSLYSVNWTEDSRAEWELHWGDTSTPDHFILLVNMPTIQSPTADSFDPNADLMVSQVVTSASQPNELSLRFARVGTIAKITLKGLPAGKTLESGTFTFPMTWPGAYMVEYDPTLGKTGLFNKPSGLISFNPYEVTVDGSGNAVLWLRTLSGTLSGWFNFDVTVSDGKGGGKPERYEKRVDLDALGRTIEFPESGITTFSVTLEKHYDLSFTNESYVTGETSIEAHLLFDLGGKPHTSVTYGLIAFDPATPDPFETVKVDTADPGEIIPLTPDGEGRVTYSATGLTPGTEYCFMPFMVIDGVAFYPEYSYFSYTTLTHYDYVEPGLVDLGLPSGTKWASFNLGSDAPLTAGYYYAWGEVRPTVSFTDSYSSKYWYQYNYTSYAKKYSTSAFKGQNGLVDMKTVLDPEDDAATVCLGGDWRTPTSEDFKELFENCNRSYVEGGYVYTSKNNGNSITLPACGFYGGSTKVTSTTYLMTSSLNIDQVTFANQAECANADGTSNDYSDGTTRGYMKFNIRPVSGGTRAGYVWTAHATDPVLGSGTATVSWNFLVPEDLENYQDYTYKISWGNDSPFASYNITRTGSYTLTGLTPGTRYYYYVDWDCRRWSSQYSVWLHSGGSSEVRSFVAE